MSTRQLIESSHRGALRRLQLPLGEVPASLAGLCLVLADGDAERALALTIKLELETYDAPNAAALVAKTQETLAKVIAEERSERGPRLQTG